MTESRRLSERLTAAKACLEQFLIPAAVLPRTRVQRLPHRIAAQSVHRHDSRFAAATTFSHALNHFQRVEVVDIDRSHRDAEDFLDLRSVRQVDGGHSPRHWQRRSCAESEAQLMRGRDHLLRPVEVPRQMFVIEDRNRSAVFAKDIGRLFEEFVARVLLLTDRVDRIIAVLADDQDRIDGQFVTAATHRFGDRLEDREAKFFGSFEAQITFRMLIDIRGDDIERRVMPATLLGIPDKEPLRHVPRVRPVPPLGRDDREAFAFLGGSLLRTRQ